MKFSQQFYKVQYFQFDNQQYVQVVDMPTGNVLCSMPSDYTQNKQSAVESPIMLEGLEALDQIFDTKLPNDYEWVVSKYDASFFYVMLIHT